MKLITGQAKMKEFRKTKCFWWYFWWARNWFCGFFIAATNIIKNRDSNKLYFDHVRESRNYIYPCRRIQQEGDMKWLILSPNHAPIYFLYSQRVINTGRFCLRSTGIWHCSQCHILMVCDLTASFYLLRIELNYLKGLYRFLNLTEPNLSTYDENCKKDCTKF